MGQLARPMDYLSKTIIELGDAIATERDPIKKERLMLARMYARMSLKRIIHHGELSNGKA